MFAPLRLCAKSFLRKSNFTTFIYETAHKRFFYVSKPGKPIEPSLVTHNLQRTVKWIAISLFIPRLYGNPKYPYLMYIVFGWNHFKIKTFDPYEIGLSQQEDPHLKIEVRQHYFHLFWIPFFSLGKKWAIRKNNELYEMPGVLKSTIKSRDDIKVRTPWYTYAGPLLLAIIGFGFMINEKVASYKSNQYSKKHFESQYAQNISLFRKPSPDDYYLLTSVKGYGQKYAKVTMLDKQHIELSYITNPAANAYEPAKIAALFTSYANEMQSVTLSRGDSSKLLTSDYDKRQSLAGISLNEKNGTTYRVEKIFRLDGPILKDGGYSSYLGSQEITMQVENEGFDATITHVEAVKGEVKWMVDELPYTLPAGKEFLLRGRGDFKKPYQVKFTLTLADGRAIHYLLEGEDSEKRFIRI
jgi:hypothetical protein